MSTLFELATEYRQDVAKLADLDIDDQTLADSLEAVEWPLAVKARNIGALITDLESQADAVLQVEARIVARRKALQARSARLRDYLLAGMQAAGVSKIDHPEASISIRANPPAVDVFDEAQIPVEFMRVPPQPAPQPDKAAIKNAIKAGQEVPGARLVQGVSLKVA